MAHYKPSISIRSSVAGGKSPTDAVHAWWDDGIKAGCDKSVLRKQLAQKTRGGLVPYGIANAISNFLASQKASVDA